MADSFTHSEVLVKNDRTYSFIINQSSTQALSLKMTELVRTEFGPEQREINVSAEDLPDFVDKLINAFVACRAATKRATTVRPTAVKPPATVPGKAYAVEAIRQVHQQAYAPWTPADDQRLRELVGGKKSVSSIANLLQRNTGAISSRIKKLDLK